MLQKKLSEILNAKTDYISYKAAHYFLGLIPKLPEEIIVISSRRRRDRAIDGVKIHFIYHKSGRSKAILLLGQKKIPVASVEQSLVDYLSDFAGNLSFEDYVEMFSCLPFCTANLQRLAIVQGETLIKRVNFWLLYSGRISRRETQDFKTRVPVFLFPKSSACISFDLKSNLYEENSRVLYPANLLSIPLKLAHHPFMTRENYLWNELRAYQPFLGWISERRVFPIKPDQFLPDVGDFTDFFDHEISRILKEELGDFLKEIFLMPSHKKFPECFANYYQNEVKRKVVWRGYVKNWIKKHLSQVNSPFFETALFHAPSQGLYRVAFAKVRQFSDKILEKNQLRALEPILDQAWEKGDLAEAKLHLLYVRVLFNVRRSNEALSHIAEIRKSGKLAGDANSLGEMALLAGNILREIRKLPQAISELKIAQSYLSLSESKGRQISINMAIGMLYKVCAKFRQARKFYIMALKMSDKETNPVIVARIFDGLARIELKAENREDGNRYLQQAMEIYRENDDFNAEVGVLIAQSQELGEHGQILQSFGMLLEAEKLVPRLAISKKKEVLILLHWMYEMCGLSAIGIAKRDSLEISEQQLSYFGKNLEIIVDAYAGLLKGNFVFSANNFVKHAAQDNGSYAPPDELGYSFFLLGLSQFLGKLPGAEESWRRACTLLKKFPGIRSDHALVVISALMPELAPGLNFEQRLKRLIKEDFFDIFWFYYIKDLFKRDQVLARKFLINHLKKTPRNLLFLIKHRASGLKNLLNKASEDEIFPENLVHFRSGGCEIQPFSWYKAWVTSRKTGPLFVDSIAGKISYMEREVSLRPGSSLFRLISLLTLASPLPLSFKSLFECVWGEPFDKDFDLPAIRTALFRAQKLLSSFSEDFYIVIEKEEQVGDSTCFLKISCSWELIFI